ncbi:hypothetical protein [Nocardioides sp. zg-1228]|uniref:hypothetical protein n=1 Tax=Nocardioides sp. zg-1228 TaxID=2763008 RepID=UPI0016431D90|nr:hypothetical protein [Nocardioides sp. zg-1228]MBC2934309.1 hypothetical protein [Nocardioides sp. zg-1228]QSF59089.1 hypothetical protein JX575_07950 [Nocardioides sp. zg-1228]
MDPRRLLPALTALACALVVATLVVALARPDRGGPAARPESGSERRSRDAAASATRRTGPAAVLAAWDAERAAAWAAGDAEALARLYADGSAAGAADVGQLRDYRRRGLRVEGLTTQVLALRVVARAPGRRELVVTDRVVGGTAVGAGTPVALPAGRPSTRRVVLVRADGRWLVAEVRHVGRAQDSAAASTSRTSSSSKS